MLVPNDPRPISRTNIVKICVRYISTRFLIIRFHLSGQYSSENSFLCLLKSCAKCSWTYITLCEPDLEFLFVLLYSRRKTGRRRPDPKCDDYTQNSSDLQCKFNNREAQNFLFISFTFGTTKNRTKNLLGPIHLLPYKRPSFLSCFGFIHL
jgi:hypothetical protein